MIIYMAKNKVNNKIYIGQTIKTLEQRKSQHIKTALSGNGFRFHDAIRRYGENNFEWSIVETVDDINKLSEREIYWIKFYDSYNRGYNGTIGDLNPMHTEETKLYHNQVMRSKEVRNKISKSMKKRIADGNFFNEQHRKRISEKLKGNQHFLGHKRTQGAIQKTVEGTRKRVVCYDVSTGDLVKEFNSVKSAAQWFYVDRCTDLKRWQNLMNAIKQSDVQNKPTRGLIWKYIKE